MKILIRLVWVHLILALTPLAAQAAIGVNSDTYSIPADGILLVEPDGVIANDTMNDVDNSPQFVLDIAINHTLSVISLPSEGTLKCGNTVNTICADGSFQFTVSPTTFSGVDSFTYRLEVDKGLPTYEFADSTVNLSACSTTGTETICWTEGSFFAALAATEDTFNPYYVKHEGFEGAAWTPYRSYQNPPPDSTWVYNGATTITSKGIAWSTNHSATNRLSTSTGGTYSGTYGVFDPDHGHATNTSTGSCQALETANNGVVPPECLPYDGFSGSSATTLYAVGGYIKGSNAAANIEIITDGGLPNNIGKLVTPAHQFYGVIDTAGFTSFQFRDIDGKTGQPLFIFGDDFYLVSRDAADANQAPVIGAIADQTVAAGSLFQIDIPVSDPDGDAVDAVLNGLPTGASLLENTLGSIRIRWITPSTAAGIYPVSVTFTDNGYPRISQVLNFTLTVTDPPPTLNLPANITAEATASTGATVNFLVTASDATGASLSASCNPASGTTFTIATTTVNCSVTDGNSLTTKGSFTVKVQDSTAPTVTAPPNIIREASAATTAVSLGSGSATDAVDGNLIPTPNNNGPFTVGIHSITWSATDTASNTGSATQTVTITDTIAPNLNLPANISQGATSANGAVVNYTVTANDIADGTIVASCSPLSGSNFALGTTAVNCSASDNSNNSVSGSFNVTITDTGAPTLSLPANISRQATAATGATVTYSATASDAIDGPIPANCSPASGSTFALGDHVVNCSAQDLEGNISNGSFIVSIIDTTPPIVTAPLDVSVEATAAVTAVTLGNASAIDLVSGTLTAVASNSGPFAVGVHTIIWSATDAANNTGTATQIVTVTDTLAPILSLPVNISHEATSAAGAVVNYTATANDIVDGALPSGCLPASGSTFALGTTTVSCSVTDSASQTTSGSFSVTVQDTTGPALTIPADISINTTSSTGAIVSYSVTATDAVDGPIVPNCLPASGSNFALGSTAVSCNASDNLNNTSTGSFKVTVINTAVNGQPVADAGSPQTVSFGSSVTLNGSASSDPDGDALQYQWTLVSKPQGSLAEIVNATMVSATFDPDQPGDYQAQLIVTDINNSRSLASRVIITVVNDAPVAHAGTDQTVFVGDLVTLNGILSSDTNADTLTYQWTLSVPAGSFAVLTRATSVNPEFTVDVAGIYTAQLTVNDGRVDSILADTVVITAQMPVDVAPTISAPADIRVPSTGYLTPIAPGVATATDPEDGVLQPVADNTGPFKTGRHVITWSVTDSGNNTVTAIQIVEVLPMVNFQLDQQAEAGALIQVNMNMNGLAPLYPVDVNYDLTVNGSTISKTLSIASGKSAVINYQVPATANAGDRITFSLKTAINAEVGANSIHHVTLINTNVAPIVDFEVTQNGVSTKNLHSNGGLVTVTAIVHDDNQSDTHTLDWSTTDNNLTPPGSVKTFSFDPANLLEGNYKIGVKVVDSGALEAENEIYVHISAQDFIPVPGADSDKDGIEDALEGDHDDDNDGVPNYLDAIDEQPEMLQMQAAESNRWIISTQSGLSLRLGKTAQLNGRYGANITPAELAQFAGLGRVTAQADTNDSDYTTTDGYLDFTINGLTKPGQSVKMVIPLLSPVPDLAVYRKYSADTGWSNFIIDAANELYSAPGADGVCPAPGSIDYLPGLEPGDYCVQMLIQDGGPNDNDLLRNAVITDPGGLAVAVTATTTPPITSPTTTAATSGSSGGGGGAIDIQSLLNMMMLLTVLSGYRVVLIRRKFGGVE